MSVKEIKAPNKQEVHPPMNFHELQEQLLMLTVASIILFGDLSFGVQSPREHDEPTQVYFQSKRTPRRRIPSQIPPRG